MISIVHISDTHGKHKELQIPQCDLLVATGDYGGRTSLADMLDFLEWLHFQPARKKIFIAGNHDHVLSKTPCPSENTGVVARMVHLQHYNALMANIAKYPDIKYLEDRTYVWEGLTIHGMPWSPEFHPDNWVYNATQHDMYKYLGRVPNNVDVLLSHGPAYGHMDLIPEAYKAHPSEDVHRGCPLLTSAIKRRFLNLKLFAFGHIHQAVKGTGLGSDNYGVRMINISLTRRLLFSNGACVDNRYNIVNNTPFIINI